MRRFEFSDAKSNKFWEIEQQDSNLQLRWGKIGTQGQSQTKAFDDAAKASAAMEKLIKEKTGKGYLETEATPESGKQPSATTGEKPAPLEVINKVTTTPAKTSKQKAKPELADRPYTPAWHASTLQLALPKKLDRIYPDRLRPGKALKLNAEAEWQKIRDLWHKAFSYTSIKAPQADPALQQLCKELQQCMQNGERTNNPQADAILVALLSYNLTNYYFDDDSANGLSSYLIIQHGLDAAVDIFLDSLQYRVRPAGGAVAAQLIDRTPSERRHTRASPAEILLRTALAQTDTATWSRCADKIQAAVAQTHISHKPTLAFLLPDLPEFANKMALDFVNNAWNADFSLLACVTNSTEALQALLHAGGWQPNSAWPTCPEHAHGWHHIYDSEWILGLIERQHSHALSLLQYFSRNNECADILAHIHHPQAITVLAYNAERDAASRQRFNGAVHRFPEAAIYALTAWLKDDPRNDFMRYQLISLLAAQPQALAQIEPWLEEESRETLRSMQHTPIQIASSTELPAVLQDAPWLKTKPARQRLQLAALDLPAQANWTETLIEQHGQLSDWKASVVEDCRNDIKTFFSRFGFGYSQKSTRDIQQRFNQAVQADDADGIIAAWLDLLKLPENKKDPFDPNVLMALPASTALKVWQGLCNKPVYPFEAGALLYYCGIDALSGLVPLIKAKPADYFIQMQAIASTELAPVAAKLFARHKKLSHEAKTWLLTHPEHAITGLLHLALGADSTEREDAALALRLLHQHGHKELIFKVATRYPQAEVRMALIELFNEDPLWNFPKSIPPAPDFFQPLACPRPILKSSKNALTDEAMQHLGTMLRFPTLDGTYAGLQQVKEACTAESLANFAWDVFTQWQYAGTPSKENWAFTQLGVLGNDTTARQLTPLIRSWPGESQHQRAVLGLDILANIGSDVALMLLNGIAQKVKFKALQDRAREKIAAIAEARELTTEELEDRLAPDLGLDDNGTLLLDFGPRQFRVGFDEALKPYVRDMQGARLKDLPKPNSKDDAELSKAAVECFKLLKKDAKTVASQQVQRLEIAMCQRRRWPVYVFVQFLANHPLLRHLVQRLVWGVYTVEGEGRYGGELQATFRVAEDGSYTDANDDEFTLPEGTIRIGLPHTLELPAEEAAAFGQLFADYELLQPFSQLGRDSHRFTEQETRANKLLRWQGKVVPTGKLFGLANRGWRRGEAQDAGAIWYYTKDLGNGQLIELTFEPGMLVGLPDEFPEQTLQELSISQRVRQSRWLEESNEPFATLDPIAASELIRDMEILIN